MVTSTIDVDQNNETRDGTWCLKKFNKIEPYISRGNPDKTVFISDWFGYQLSSQVLDVGGLLSIIVFFCIGTLNYPFGYIHFGNFLSVGTESVLT